MHSRPTENPALSIGLVTPGWPAEAFSNGVVTYVATLLPSLCKMGHGVALLAGQVDADLRDPTIYDLARFLPSRRLPRRLLYGLASRIFPRSTRLRLFASIAQQMISEHAVEIVEMEESFGAAANLRSSVSIPVCVRLHGPWFLNGPATGAADDDAFRERVRAEREGIAVADGVSAPSRDVLDRVRAGYSIELPEAEVIPHPVAPVPAGARWKLPASDTSRVLFVGRFDRHKGGDLIIEAFRQILKEVPRARLSFVGPDRGCVTDDGRSWSLPEFVHARLPGALESGQIEWLGQQPLAALGPLRRSALVTVVASRYETFCYTAAEAMALGCPVVATGAGAIPEIVQHGSNGLLCRPEDPADLAEKVVGLMSDPARAAALGRQAAEDCERLYHPDVIAGRIIAFYRRVLARGRGNTSRRRHEMSLATRVRP
jgi:glycosyltransferase involved in cell wall biosynthesis